LDCRLPVQEQETGTVAIQRNVKISLKILLILHLADKRLYSNILQLHFNFKITLF
jgi:hypothetical protein